MARRVKVSAAILNLRLHPHPDGIYSSYLLSIYKLKKSFKIYGDRHGMISSLSNQINDDGDRVGIITTFVVFNKDGPWFDVGELEVASEEKISKINIPDGLFPSSHHFYFVLDAKKHRIYVQNYSAGATFTTESIERFWSEVTSDISITQIYGQAILSVVQDKAALERLFSIDVIKKITITISRPNPDIFSDDFETAIEQHLAETHARKFSLTYEAGPGESLVPNQELRSVGEAALEHGDVEVKGRDSTGSITKSTSQFPKIVQDRFDPSEISEREAILRLVGKSKTQAGH